MPVNRLIFKDAEKARDSILDSQKKEIEKLYKEWAEEVSKMSTHYANKKAPSYALQAQQMKILKKNLEEQGKQLSKEVEKKIKSNIYLVAESVVKSNNTWMSSLGFNNKLLNANFSNIPIHTVNNLITGQIYDSGWSLSKRIWSDNKQTMKDVYAIVAKGVATQAPIYEISKELERYVNPSKKMKWNTTGKDGVKIYKKSVDYCAQRLARTLVQHGYQQSFVAVTKNNPMIKDYIWISNGSRVCELCKSRNGQHFKKDELPLDHPNGMCIIQPNVSSTLVDDLANWYNSPDGTYPEFDNFAKDLGYKPQSKAANQGNQIKTTGNSDDEKALSIVNKMLDSANYEDGNFPEFGEWYNWYTGTLTDEERGQLESYLKKNSVSGNNWNKYTYLRELYSDKAKANAVRGIKVDNLAKTTKEVVKKNIVEKNIVDKIGSDEWYENVLYKNMGAKLDKYKGAELTDDVKKLLLKEMKDCKDENVLNAFNYALEQMTAIRYDGQSCSFYHTGFKSINIDLMEAQRLYGRYGAQSKNTTFFHEMGHAIDYNNKVGKNSKLSSRKSFMKAIESDLDKLIKDASAPPGSPSSVVKRANTIKEMLARDANAAGIQDAVSGAKCLKKYEWEATRLQTFFSHSKEYWLRGDTEKEIASELFANMTAAKFSDKSSALMQEYFPNSYKEYDKLIKLAIKEKK